METNEAESAVHEQENAPMTVATEPGAIDPIAQMDREIEAAEQDVAALTAKHAAAAKIAAAEAHVLDLRIAREERQVVVLDEAALDLSVFVGLNYFLDGGPLHRRDSSFALEVERKFEQKRTSAQDRLDHLRRQKVSKAAAA